MDLTQRLLKAMMDQFTWAFPVFVPTVASIMKTVSSISYENYPKWTKRVTPQENDVVFSYEANLESYARIPAGFEGCLGRRMAIMRPDPSAIDARFLYCYTQSPAWKAVIASRTVLGATVNRIPIATFPEFPLRLPSLPAQQRIAGVLSAYDKLIENNRRQIKLLGRGSSAPVQRMVCRPALPRPRNHPHPQRHTRGMGANDSWKDLRVDKGFVKAG